MKKQILFIHSAGAQGPHEGSTDLVLYLRDMLGNGYEVLFPRMPDPENPRYFAWKDTLKKESFVLSNDVILVGHSLGGSVLLKYLSEEPFNKLISGLFLVAPPYWGAKDWEIEEYVLQRDFEAMLPQIPKIFLYHSREDMWVPVTHLDHYKRKFPDATVRVLEGDEHEFFYGLPELVDDIKSLNKNGRSF